MTLTITNLETGRMSKLTVSRIDANAMITKLSESLGTTGYADGYKVELR